METIAEWSRYCKENVTAGYTPGGDASNIPATGELISRFLIEKGIIHEPQDILDVGNGNGRLAIALSMNLNSFSYHGLDVIKPCVEFCKGAFAEDSRYRFTHLDIENKHYWAMGSGKPEGVTFPIASASKDIVVAFSLFTHFETKRAVIRYLSEMVRCLRGGGGIFATWSLTTMCDQVTLNAKHAVFHINDVLKFYEGFKHFEFIALRQGAGSPNQVGIWATI